MGKQKTRHPWIYRLDNGKYQATWKDPGGRHHARNFERLNDAIAHRANVMTDPKVGRKPTKTTLDEFWPTFIRTGSKRGAYEPATKALYGQQYGRYLHPRFGHWPLPAVTSEAVAGMIADLLEEGTGRATVAQVRRLLHRIFEIARRDRLVRENPVTDTAAPVAERRAPRVYRAEELEAHAKAAEQIGGASDGAMIRLMGWTGLRISEATGLRVRDFDPFTGQLTVREARKEVGGRIVVGSPKGDRYRRFPLPGFMRQLLIDYLRQEGIGGEPDRPMFATRAGKPITPSNWRDRIWKKAAEKASIPNPPRPHDLRHTAVSLMRSANVPTHVVMEIVGHATASMTGQYTHVSVQDLEFAAAQIHQTYS